MPDRRPALRGFRQRAAEAFAGFATSLRNPRLRRVQLAWAGCAGADLAQDVALGVYAFSVGGVTGVGWMGLVRALPAGVAGPLLAGLADRHARHRVMVAVLLCRAALLGALAGVLAAEWPLGVVYVVAALDSVVYTLYWPAQTALLPQVSATPEELTAANVASTLVENTGMLAGPALAGVLLAVSGPPLVVATSAGVLVVAALVAARIGGEEGMAGRAEAASGESFLAGFRALLGEPGPRLVFGLYLAHTVCYGALGTLVVALALDLLEIGDAGVGFLNAALGVGGLVGAVGAIGLVGHGRLTRPLALSLTVWGVALATVALALSTPVAAVALAVMGGCTAVVDVCSIDVLQRVVRERVLGRALGVVEGAYWAAYGLGSLAAALLAGAVGPRGAIAATGLALGSLALVSARRLRAIDGQGPGADHRANVTP